ncbi:hypothetical protein DNTS_007214 [Danionella cerebrum]|uniref:AT-rich interactive domain-containing protein 1B n=1 Tax=Danionella cerebrum TaxID=2873325 RepID=A0A553PIR5_9TELE|nr:hypothetical protein DNTS_007214 [Danionella translucida]
MSTGTVCSGKAGMERMKRSDGIWETFNSSTHSPVCIRSVFSRRAEEMLAGADAGAEGLRQGPGAHSRLSLTERNFPPVPGAQHTSTRCRQHGSPEPAPRQSRAAFDQQLRAGRSISISSSSCGSSTVPGNRRHGYGDLPRLLSARDGEDRSCGTGEGRMGSRRELSISGHRGDSGGGGTASQRGNGPVTEFNHYYGNGRGGPYFDQHGGQQSPETALMHPAQGNMDQVQNSHEGYHSSPYNHYPNYRPGYGGAGYGMLSPSRQGNVMGPGAHSPTGASANHGKAPMASSTPAPGAGGFQRFHGQNQQHHSGSTPTLNQLLTSPSPVMRGYGGGYPDYGNLPPQQQQPGLGSVKDMSSPYSHSWGAQQRSHPSLSPGNTGTGRAQSHEKISLGDSQSCSHHFSPRQPPPNSRWHDAPEALHSPMQCCFVFQLDLWSICAPQAKVCLLSLQVASMDPMAMKRSQMYNSPYSQASGTYPGQPYGSPTPHRYPMGMQGRGQVGMGGVQYHQQQLCVAAALEGRQRYSSRRGVCRKLKRPRGAGLSSDSPRESAEGRALLCLSAQSESAPIAPELLTGRAPVAVSDVRPAACTSLDGLFCQVSGRHSVKFEIDLFRGRDWHQQSPPGTRNAGEAVIGSNLSNAAFQSLQRGEEREPTGD